MPDDKQTATVSIVIPVYNEVKRIEGFLFEVIDFLKKKAFPYELIIVDDGSTDETTAVTDSLLQAHLSGTYRILKLPKNCGKGAAVRKGMLEACGDYIFFIDADGSTSITEIDNFMPHLSSGYDIYVAVRTIKHKAPFKRQFFGRGYIYLANVLLGTNISDFTCGFKCYRRDTARTIFPRQTLTNWSFDAEDLFIASINKCRIKEIPVYWKHVGGSKVRVFKNVIECGLDLLRIRYNKLRGTYERAL